MCSLINTHTNIHARIPPSHTQLQVWLDDGRSPTRRGDWKPLKVERILRRATSHAPTRRNLRLVLLSPSLAVERTPDARLPGNRSWRCARKIARPEVHEVVPCQPVEHHGAEHERDGDDANALDCEQGDVPCAFLRRSLRPRVDLPRSAVSGERMCCCCCCVAPVRHEWRCVCVHGERMLNRWRRRAAWGGGRGYASHSIRVLFRRGVFLTLSGVTL